MAVGAQAKARALARRATVALEYERIAHSRRAPIDDDTVVYESFSGNGMLCNPEAIFRALLAAPRSATPAPRLGACEPRRLRGHHRRVRRRPSGQLRGAAVQRLLQGTRRGQVPRQQRHVPGAVRQAPGPDLRQHLARHAAEGDGLRRARGRRRHPQRRAQLPQCRLPAGAERGHRAHVPRRLPHAEHLPRQDRGRRHAAHRQAVRRRGRDRAHEGHSAPARHRPGRRPAGAALRADVEGLVLRARPTTSGSCARASRRSGRRSTPTSTGCC